MRKKLPPLKNKLEGLFFKTLIFTFFFVLVLRINAEASIQNNIITLDVKNVSVKEFINQIQKNSQLDIVYISDDIAGKETVTYKCKDKQIVDVLKESLLKLGLNYKIQNETITIYRDKSVPERQPNKNIQPKKVAVSGKITDKETKKPIAGATIILNNGVKGAISDENGAFLLQAVEDDKIFISYVGYKEIEHVVTVKSVNLIFSMEPNVIGVDDVVVTGIYSRKKESFTGSASTYTNKDLKMVGSTNLLQSLKTLDPTFVMLDSKKFGSDPNRLPDLEIRGTTSVAGLKSEFGEDPNRPLFILDGVECRLEDVINLNMDRVESITILKDAASTAIYGSKAANGVVVVETVQPKAGKLRLSYNGNFVLTMPDLSDYNLMNAAEKLEFEKLAGYYGNVYGLSMEQYNSNLTEILRGVDTYWLSQPLRTVLNNTHNIYVDGGEGAIRYGIGVNYNGNNGVMKGSAKDVVGANLQLSYRTSKLIFSNKFTTNITTSSREPVTFSNYAKQNPYYRIYGADGDYIKYTFIDDKGIVKELNPCYVAQFPNDVTENNTNFNNNFTINWRVLDELKIDANFYISNNIVRHEEFKSPKHPDFENGDPLKSGSFNYNSDNALSYSGRFTAAYGKLFNEIHQVNVVIGGDFSHNNTTSTGYNVIGFASDLHQNPQYSAGFTEGQVPSYSINKARTANFYANANYSFKNRYLVDANIRMDGTSRFGSNKMFSKTWAVGLAWNLHNEKFIKENVKWINNLKIRASIGNPGNQNFDAYLAYKTYIYNSDYQNVFGTSALIEKYGNKDLEWQRTMDRNIGFDMTLLNNRLNLYIDYYNKKTDPLLIDVKMPPSTGAGMLKTNLGGQRSTGMSGRLNYYIFRRENFHWNINYNFRIGKSEYFGIGNTLAKLNLEALAASDAKSEANKVLLSALYDTDTFKRYYDGGDPNDLYSVRSLGIDPATGREVFLDAKGNPTFEYVYNAQVKVGNSRPDIAGVIGTNLNYKNFTFNISLGYSFGAQQMASAIYQKVENIDAGSMKYNQDKRALYDRWHKPGDVAKFSSLTEIVQNSTKAKPISSRFLVTEDFLSLESISVGYDFDGEWMKAIGLTGANLNIYLNNIARITSFKEERGIDYPFARSITFAIGLRF